MEEELLQLARELAQRYFVRQDFAWITARLAPGAAWLGLGPEKVLFGKQQISQRLLEHTQAPPQPLQLFDEQYHAFALSPQAGAVAVTACVRQPEIPQPALRFTVAFQRLTGEWRIALFHCSAPCRPDLFARSRAFSASPRDLAQDPLTGILNMEGFVRRAGALLCAQPLRRYALVKINVIRFRYINQSCGYSTGDEVLRSIARNLQAACLPGEVCGRPEKDNFALLCLYPGSETALEERLGALRPALLDAGLAQRLPCTAGFSIGVYLPPPGCCENVKDMLDKAMMASHSLPAPDRANHYAYFRPELWQEKLQEGRWLEEMPAAMENGEFRLYIQPQVSLRTLQAVAGEALVRWVKPSGVVVMPDQFIPLYENSGAILQFDFYMLELLCRQMQQWIDMGIAPETISINQSRRHIHDSHYLKHFCAVVDRYHIPHGHIAFELTESAFVEDSDQMACLASALHEQGFLLSIDDFGAGYASLNMLGRIKADILKIDRSLIAGYGSNPRSGVILRKVVEMAHETHMTVVCEGVETRQQCTFLQQLGCDLAQGFYFYRPMPAGQFERQILRGVAAPPGKGPSCPVSPALKTPLTATQAKRRT